MWEGTQPLTDVYRKLANGSTQKIAEGYDLTEIRRNDLQLKRSELLLRTLTLVIIPQFQETFFYLTPLNSLQQRLLE